jgi:hypothetical protein
MAIRNVGGQPVYVIDAPAVEQARTSAGTGYASLVSQLRWQIWEASRQAVKDQMEFEKLGYEAKLDAFVKEKQELTRALAKAKDIKEKIKTGQVSAATALAAARLELDVLKYNQARADKENIRVSQRDFIDPISGEKSKLNTLSMTRGPGGEPLKRTGVPSAAALLERGAEAVGYKSPEDKKAEAEAAAQSNVKNLEKEWLAAWKASGIEKSKDFAKSEVGKPAETALQEAKDALAKIVATPAEELAKTEEDAKADQELADYETELQRRLDLLNVPEPTFDTNVLSRTRETFGGMAGIGAFGFAPRREKISPIYDEARAREALDRAKAIESEAVSLSTAEKYNAKKAALLSARESAKQNRIAELESLMGSAGVGVVGAIAGAGDQVQKAIGAEIAKLKATPVSLNAEEEFALSSSSKQEAQRELASGLLDVGPGPRTAASFMTRQPPEVPRTPRPERPPRPPRKPRDRDRDRDFGKFLGNIYDNLGNVPPTEFSVGATAEAGLGFAPSGAPIPADSPAVSGATSGRGGGAPAPEGSPVVSPAVSDIPSGRGFAPEIEGPPQFRTLPPATTPEEDIILGGGPLPPSIDSEVEGAPMRRRLILPETYIEGTLPPRPPAASGAEAPSGPPPTAAVYDPQNKILFNKSTGFPEFVVGVPTANPDGSMPKQITKAEMKAKLEELSSSGEQIYNSSGKQIQPDQYQKIIEDLSAALKQNKTRQDRSAAYALKIVNKGKELADKPAKLARIAKTDLPEAERIKKVPEHIALVDKLYEINKGKTDVYKSTYSEIARVYEKQPKLRDAALEYLVAKNLLYGNIS